LGSDGSGILDRAEPTPPPKPIFVDGMLSDESAGMRAPTGDGGQAWTREFPYGGAKSQPVDNHGARKVFGVVT
jgi:hypothetical protein